MHFIQSKKTKKPSLPAVAGKLGLVLACVLFVIWAIPSKPGVFTWKKPLTQQVITLDDSKPTQLVDFFSLQKPGQSGPSVMAVIWGTGAGGNYQVIYSSTFNDSDWPHPVWTIDLPGTRKRLALISSGDVQHQYLHYRLVGYSGHSINTYLEEDYVPGGELGFREGMLIERRIAQAPQNPQETKAAASMLNRVVTCIIPYHIEDTGEVLLPTDHVQLSVGEQLLLIGNGVEKEIQFYSPGHSIQNLPEEVNPAKPRALFRAFSAGEDRVLLAPSSTWGQSKSLYVNVID